MKQKKIKREFKISNTKPKKGLTVILKKHSGRDNSGKISMLHQGGRQKRYYRIIDFKRSKRDIEGTVMEVQYDPNRNAHISLVRYADNEYRYILHPKGLAIGAKILAGESVDIIPGNATMLKKIPIGIEVHNVEMHPNQGGSIVRSAGSFGVVIAKDGGYVSVKMPSGEIRKIIETCYATIGRVGNVEHKDIILGKAGRKRLMGVRPSVRGTAQNPRSHPHGGGEGRSGEGMHPKTPWGKKARGKKTAYKKRWSKKFIVTE